MTTFLPTSVVTKLCSLLTIAKPTYTALQCLQYHSHRFYRPSDSQTGHTSLQQSQPYLHTHRSLIVTTETPAHVPVSDGLLTLPGWRSCRLVGSVWQALPVANKGSLMQAAVQRVSTHVRPPTERYCRLKCRFDGLVVNASDFQRLISAAERQNGSENELARGRVRYKAEVLTGE